LNITIIMKPDYQRFFLTELVALIQRKYKFEVSKTFYQNKREYILMKPDFTMQVYSPKESETYNCVFTMNFFYSKITRSLY